MRSEGARVGPRGGDLQSMMRPHPIALAIRLLSGAVLGVLAACPGCPLFTPSDSCHSVGDCKAGYLCVNQRCAKACNNNQDCGNSDLACLEGYCAPVPAAECATANDCTSPGPCEVAAGASCSSGSCQYQPKAAGESCAEDNPCTSDERCDGQGRCAFVEMLCVDPPDAECVEGDTIYRSYSNP